MRDKKIAIPYAEAIIGALKDEKQMEAVYADLMKFAAVYSGSGELRKALGHPNLPDETKKRILKGVLEKEGITAGARSLEVVLRRKRIDHITDIAAAYSALLDARLGRQSVRVRSAYPLDGGAVSGLEAAFSKLTGKKAKVDVAVDKSLIGGLVAHVGSKVYDGSISNQLNALKVKLEQEA